MTEEDQAAKPQSNTFMYLAGGMLVIVVLLAGLLVGTRLGADRARKERPPAAQMDPSMALLMAQLQRGGARLGVDRGALPLRIVQLDGKPTGAFVVPAEVGMGLGLQPGDVVIVEHVLAPLPESDPTTTSKPK